MGDGYVGLDRVSEYVNQVLGLIIWWEFLFFKYLGLLSFVIYVFNISLI